MQRRTLRRNLVALAILSATFLTGCPWATTSGATRPPALGLTRAAPKLFGASLKRTPRAASSTNSRRVPTRAASSGGASSSANASTGVLGGASSQVDQQSGLSSVDPSEDVLSEQGPDSIGESLNNDTLQEQTPAPAPEVESSPPAATMFT